MKYRYLMLGVMFFFFACSHKLTGNKYVHVDVAKEWDLELILKNDSTFTLEDQYGCNKMSQKGYWFNQQNIDSIFHFGMLILVDTLTQTREYTDLFKKKYLVYRSCVDSEEYKSLINETYFQLIKFDTIRILNNNRSKLLFRGITFDRNNKSIKGVRIKKQERELILKLGKETYINIYGNGKEKKTARKKLEKCGS